MALLKYGDRVREVTSTEGSADYVLGGVTDPLERTFVQGIGLTEWCYYCCESTTDWEIGYGQITTIGADTVLTRNTIFASSNNDLKVPWSVGSKTIFNTATAAALDHIAGFTINQGNISFNRGLKVATTGQTTFEHIYIRGSLEVYIDGALIQESEYSAVDGINVVFNTGLTVGQIVEFIAIGQYTATHSVYESPVPSGQLFKSGMFFKDTYRNEAGVQDGFATDCVRYKWNGIEGDGVAFNGTSSKIDFTDFGFDHSSPFTLAFWFKTAATLADGILISNQAGLDTDGYFEIRVLSTGALVVAVLDNLGAEQTITYTITANTAYHFVVHYDSVNLSLYVNNIQATPLAVTSKTTSGINDLALGYSVSSLADFCAGFISGINLYASALTPAEITSIFSEPDGPNVTDLTAVVVPGGSVATSEDIVAMVIALG